MKYKDITIEQAEILYNSNIYVVCDADKQEIIYSGAIVDTINSIMDAFNKMSNAIIETVNNIYNTIRGYVLNLYSKKISKKRFIKLLQSYGLQRNYINKLIRGNKDKYTTWRVLESIPPYF